MRLPYVNLWALLVGSFSAAFASDNRIGFTMIPLNAYFLGIVRVGHPIGVDCMSTVTARPEIP